MITAPADLVAECGIRQAPAEPRITGFVGLVIQPDAATIRRSYELAARLVPRGAPLLLARGLLPHVTLTQCALRDAPAERIAGFIQRLERRLKGRAIPLSTVAAFAGGFVFWHVDDASPERRIMQSAHEEAIAVADGLLDPVANAAVVQGTITATNDDATLVGNARTYGYAFIKDRYVPHITLGFDPSFAVEPGGASAFVARTEPQTMTVERVVLASFGPLARVQTILSI